MKRLLAMLLALCMVLSMVPATVFAAEETTVVTEDTTAAAEETTAATEAVPSTAEEIVNAAYALGTGESLSYEATLSGVITAINTAYSSTYLNVTVTMVVDNMTDKPILCYRLKGDGADQIGVGDTITVTGILQNYNGTIEFGAGCTLDKWEDTGAAENLTTPEEIVNAAYALGVGECLQNTYTLTGVISGINFVYNATYGYITVTMVVDDMSDKPIQCYRLKGDGVDQITAGDTITVTGSLKNYNGTVEFDSGCTLDAWEDTGAAEEVLTEPADILKAAYALEDGFSLQTAYTLTGVITSVDKAYSAANGYITVTMVVDGMTAMPIQCNQLTGDGVDVIGVDDTITVTGNLRNVNGTVRYAVGCTLDLYIQDIEDPTEPETSDPWEPETSDPTVEETTPVSSEPTAVRLTVENYSRLELVDSYTEYTWNEETQVWDRPYQAYGIYPVVTVELSTGEVLTSDDGYFEYNGCGYWVGYTHDQSYETPWGVGEHTVQAELFGATTTFTVTVEENPVASIGISDVTLIQNSCGYNADVWDDSTQTQKSYYCYSDILPSSGVTINLKNGEVITDNYYNYNGREFWLSYSTDQSYENQWGLGAHTASVSFMGYETTYTVNIVESPVESITVGNKTVMEGTNGWYDSYWDENGQEHQYFRYSLENYDYTVTLKNGETFSNSSYYSYEGKDYWVNFTSDQSYENQWGAGDHAVTLSFMGYETTYTLTVEESPFESITFSDVYLIENSGGYYTAGYDPETGTEQGFYCYNLPDPAFTVTMKDGTVLESYSHSYSWDNNQYVDYNGTTYSVEYSFGQSYENRLTVGTNQLTANVLGVTGTVNVIVEEMPVESVAFDAVTLQEYASGYYTNDYNPETGNWDLEYYRYSIPQPSFTVTLKDGTQVKSVTDHDYYPARQYFTYRDTKYYPEYSIEQSGEAPLSVGTYEISVSLMGCSTTFTLTVEPMPYVALEVTGVSTLKQYENCWSNDGTLVYDRPHIEYRLLLEDGSSVVRSTDWDASNYYYDEALRLSDDQANTPWLPGGENLMTVKYGSLETQVNVPMEATAEYEYLVQNGQVYITACNLEHLNALEIPSEIDGLPVVAIVSLGNNWANWSEITIPDSVTTIGASALNFYYLSTLNIGSGVEYLDYEMLSYGEYVQNVNISADNPNYCSVDGVVYDKNMQTLIYYPRGREGTYVVPASVTNIDVLDNYTGLSITFEEGSTAGVTVDGVTYNADMTKIISCSKELAGEYIMPDTVTKVAPGAFENCDQLTKVVIGAGVTEITYRQFANCDTLTEVELPDTLTTIGDGAFDMCFKLESIELPAELTSLGASAFADTALTQITIPDKLEAIGAYAFAATPMTQITFGASLKTIGNGAFQSTQFTELALTDTIEYLGDYSFAWAPLSELTLTDTVTHIGSYAFAWTKLSQFTVPAKLTYMGNFVFENTAFTEAYLYIPETVTYWGSGTYAWCEQLAKVTLDESLTYIPASTFCGTALTEVTIPDGVTSIGNNAFGLCYSLAEVQLPKSLVSVGERAFDECPISQLELYEGLESIGDFAFANTDITELYVPDTVTDIAYGAFYGASSLYTIDLPETLEHLGPRPFDQTALYNEQPDGMFYVENALTSYKGSLQSPEPVVKYGTYIIADSTFENKAITQITLPATMRVIGNGAFDHANLNTVRFAGTQEQWDALSVGYGNSVWEAATVEFFTPAVTIASAASMEPGQTYTLTATTDPADQVLTWTSSDESVATVEDGVITAVANGTAVITAQFLYGSEPSVATCTVTVKGPIASGTCGSNLTWRVNEAGRLTISGEGAMDNYISGYWSGYNISSVVIEEGVTTIGYYAFSSCYDLQLLSLPASLTTVYSGAFSNTYSLQHVLYAGTQEQWDAISVYDSNYWLRDGTRHVEATMDTIMEMDMCVGVGQYCTLCERTICVADKSQASHSYEDGLCTKCGAPEGLEYIIRSGEVYVTGYTGTAASLTVPETIQGMPVTQISGSAFAQNGTLTQVSLPDSVTQIAYAAFQNCDALISVELPSQLQSISQDTFSGCSSLMDIQLPDSVTDISYRAFQNCSSLMEITIPSGVSAIEDSTFSNCTNLMSVELPEGINRIGSSAFSSCSSLMSVDLPDTVTRIGNYAFSGCSSMFRFDMSANVTQLGYSAFSGCSSLIKLTLPEGLTQIQSSTFESCISLTDINIPETVTQISSWAFAQCYSLADINIPAAVTSIGSYAFGGCDGLTAVDITDLESWSRITFGSQDSNPLAYARDLYLNGQLVSELVFPESITVVKPYAFAGGSFETITLHDGIASMGQYAFYNCDHVQTVTLPAKLASVQIGCFAQCDALQSVVLPEGLQLISSNAFQNCDSLTDINIPDGVRNIGQYAFQDCDSLTDINIPGSVLQVGNYAFSYCGSLTEVTLGEGTEQLGSHAFYNCEQLAAVTVPASVAGISANAFGACTGLTEITFAGSAPSINAKAFTNVTATAYYPANDESWTADVMQNYGGTLTWTAVVAAGVQQWSMSLGDDLGMHFYVAADDDTVVQITVGQTTNSYTAADAQQDENGLYIFSVELAAAQMTDEVTVQVLSGGAEVDSGSYTVRRYADAILSGDYDDATKALVREMLNYGAAAQVYFGYNTENLANDGIEGAGQTAVPEAAATEMSVTGSASGVSFYGATLVFGSKNAVRFYFQTSGKITDHTFTVDGTAYTPVEKNGMYYVEVADIDPQELADAITLSVDGSLHVTYSPMNYMVRMSVNGSESLRALMKAMYNYYLAASQLV